MLAASLVPTTLAGHRFWEETDPQAKAMQRLQFAKNTSVLGGLLLASKRPQLDFGRLQLSAFTVQLGFGFAHVLLEQERAVFERVDHAMRVGRRSRLHALK